MFRIDGKVDVEIVDACLAEAKFPAKDGEPASVLFDIVLTLQDAEGNTDMWHGEISNRPGMGNFSHMDRTGLTIKTLQDIGFFVNSFEELQAQFAMGEDGTMNVPNLVGIRCTAVVAKSDSTDSKGNHYYNIKYLNRLGGGVKKLTADDLAALLGKAAPQVQPAQQTQVAPAPQATGQQPVAYQPPAQPTAPPAPPAPKNTNCPY